jgi:hypothetical protein
MPQGSLGQISIFDDFLGPDNDLTWGTGTVRLGRFGFVSVNEGSFEWTVDEPGGIVAITTDTGDDDNAVVMAGTFKPADGPIVTEWRFKFSNVDCAIFAGFTETLALDTPVMPAEFATATMSYRGSGGMVGIQYDVDGTTDDFRAVFGDGGAAVSGADAAGTRANATVIADRWYIARVEVDPEGTARVYFGDADNTKTGIKLVKTVEHALTATDVFYAVLMIENRSAAARVLEVDYGLAEGYRDWAVD